MTFQHHKKLKYTQKNIPSKGTNVPAFLHKNLVIIIHVSYAGASFLLFQPFLPSRYLGNQPKGTVHK
jgi:hypothetical protein